MKCIHKIRLVVSKYSFGALLILTTIFICFLNPDLLRIQKVCHIEISAAYHEAAAHGQEIWLVRALVNGEEVPVNTLKIGENLNWKYANDTDDWIFQPKKNAIDNILVLEVESPSDIELIFLKNSWSGTVQISTQGKSETIDLYSEISDAERYFVNKDDFTYAYMEKIIEWIGLLAVISVLVSLIQVVLKKAPLINKVIVTCDILSFYTLNKYDLLNGVMVTLVISCLLYMIFVSYYPSPVKYEGKKFSFAKFLLHIYFVFALVGNRIFMTEALMTFGVMEIGNFAVASLALWPSGTIITYIFDKCKSCIRRKDFTNKQIRKVRIICFLITFFLLILMTLGFYPATIPVDGVSHWTQAVGYLGWGIQDNTSGAFTILLRICYKICSSPYGFILLILFLFSFIMARILTYFFVKGVPTCVVYCISAIIAILPNNYTTLLTIKTNSLYTILCIWVTYLLMKLLDNSEKISRNVGFIIEMSIVLPCLYVCRHNSFLTVFGTCVILISMCIKYAMQYKKMNLYIVIPVVATLFIVKIITGPIYTHFDVIRNAPQASGVAYPMISPLAVAYNNNVELTEDTLEYMNRIRPLEYWSNHNRYHGDTFTWSEPLPQYKQINGNSEKFKYYFKLLFSRPDIVIKDRLDGIESLWNVFGSKGQKAYNARFFFGINTNMPKDLVTGNGWNWNITTVEGNRVYFHETAFTRIPYAICMLFAKNVTLDAFVWRTGFSIILVLYAFHYTYVIGNKKKMVAVIPMLGTLITLVLAISWQLYQYFWVVHIINWILILYFILPGDDTIGQEEKLTMHIF